MRKLGILVGVFGLFALVGTVSASTAAEQLQPASTITYEEELVVNNTARFDSVYIGKQDEGGVTFFNGTIINSTTGEGDADNPVTFGDNVRIDGVLYRGETEGAGDNYPLKVSDDVRIYGDLTVDGNIDIAYDNTASGLSSDNVQDAIDEIGTQLSDAISRSGASAASAASPGELTASTWRGSSWRIERNEWGAPYFHPKFTQRTGLYITFTPTSETGGTYSANNGVITAECDTIDPCTPLPADTVYTGTYKIIGDKIMIKDHLPRPDGAAADPSYRYANILRDFVTVGDVMTFENTSGSLVELTRE